MYKSLDTIPYKLFIAIVESGEIYHLSNTDKEPEEFMSEEIVKLNLAWDKIYNQYLALTPNDEERKTLNIKREIEFFECKHKLVLMCCECLFFDWNDEIVNVLKGFGYQINDDANYYDYLETIERESEGLLVKCDRLKKMLPPETDEEITKPKGNTDDMFASFSAILGIDFDYNTISVTKTMALRKQVESKIKQLESQNTKAK